MSAGRSTSAPTVWIAALLAAGLINSGFVVLMETMVASDGVRRVNAFEAEPIEWVRTPVEEQTRSKDRRRSPPPKPQQVQRQTMRIEQTEAASFHDLPMPDAAFDVASLLDTGGAGIGGAALGERLVQGQGGGGGPDLATVGVHDLVPLVLLPPQYPPGALMRGITGHVSVSFVVDDRGLVRDVTVLEAEPQGVFEDAAEQAVMRWRFKPYRRNGEPVVVVTSTRIVFDRQLEEGEISGT